MIIGIGHKARQGKDTAAEILELKYGFIVIHFADALYDECRNSTIIYNDKDNMFYMKCYDEEYYKFENPPEHIKKWILSNGSMESGLPLNGRLIYRGMKEKDGALLQFWGTEFRRKKFDWDYWVKKVKDVIDNEPENDYVIPDARFKNEAEFIKDCGGEIWKIIRPEYNRLDRDPNHRSEVDLDDWIFDEIIVNDGTIEELHEKVARVYKKEKEAQ